MAYIGEQHPQATMTSEVVKQLRQALKLRRTLTNKALARKFGITSTAVKHVLSNKRWKHVK
jgi:hypothetical protein